MNSRRKRILVMDDEEAVREVVVMMLDFFGYEVAEAVDGHDAIAKYVESIEQGRKFDAVIVDLTVPGGMGGKEAMVRLREIDPEVRAIVASGFSLDPITAEEGRCGFRGIVAKPFRMDVLEDTLTAVLAD